MSKGWICLHRQMLEWEWYSDTNVTRLFIHCLLKANHKDKKWQGKAIPRGSFITGRNVLADETGLTVRQIRTALDKLKSTNDLTIKATNKNSLVTVVNYDLYQDKDNKTTNKTTNNEPNERPTDDQQTTTTNNVNNETMETSNKKKDAPLDFSILGFLDNQVEDLKRIRKANKGTKLTQRIINALAKEFNSAMGKGYSIDELLTEWEVRGWKSFKSEWINQKSNQPMQYSDVTQQNIETFARVELK